VPESQTVETPVRRPETVSQTGRRLRHLSDHNTVMLIIVQSVHLTGDAGQSEMQQTGEVSLS
jgi:hypothetical protein